MKQYFYYTLALVFGVSLFMGCNSKEDSLDIPLESAEVLPSGTPLEKRTKELYDKYNVKFNYLWDKYAFARNVIADPADEQDVLPYIEVFNELFFEAIKKVSGEEFIESESPLTIFLLGSGINYGGSQSFGEGTAGQAGNIRPNRLTLGGLNEFGILLRSGTDEAFLNYILEDHTNSFPSEAGEVGFIYHEYNTLYGF